jgi:nicotinamide mononucleotide (NMN) deamidase PncC
MMTHPKNTVMKNSKKEKQLLKRSLLNKNRTISTRTACTAGLMKKTKI